MYSIQGFESKARIYPKDQRMASNLYLRPSQIQLELDQKTKNSPYRIMYLQNLYRSPSVFSLPNSFIYGPRSCSTTKFSHSSFKSSAIVVFTLESPFLACQNRKGQIKILSASKRQGALDDETAAVILLAKPLVKGPLVNKF